MTLNVDLSPHTQQRLETLAAKQGQPLEVYVSELIERTIRIAEPIDAILAPFRQGFAESGMSDNEAATMLETELKEVRAKRRTKSLS